jgi:hypothetical protein
VVFIGVNGGFVFIFSIWGMEGFSEI